MSTTVGYGTTIAYSTTLGGSYTTVAEVVSLKLPKQSCNDIKTVHMTSAGKVITYVPGLIEPGTAELVAHFDKTVYNVFENTLKFVPYFWKVTYNDTVSTASTTVFPGYVKEVGPEVDLDG